MNRLILALGISILTFTGCAQEEKKTENVTQTQQELSGIQRISKTAFKSYLDSHSEALLIDVRTPQEFASGNIEGAININFNDAEFEENIKALDKNVPVLIYCKSGGRSARALKIFEANGFNTVLELNGGYSNW